MPKKAEHHIQNTAPGPPMATAPATPAMLPVPTVPARAVHTAWNGLMEPSLACFRSNTLPRVQCMASLNFRTWMQRVRRVSSKPTPTMQMMAGTPQMKLFTAPLIRVIHSIIIYPLSFLPAGERCYADDFFRFMRFERLFLRFPPLQ